MDSALAYSGVTLYPRGGNRSSKCLPVQTEWEATRLFSFFFFFCEPPVSQQLSCYVWHRDGPPAQGGAEGPAAFCVRLQLPGFMASETTPRGGSRVPFCDHGWKAVGILFCLLPPHMYALCFHNRGWLWCWGRASKIDDLNACDQFPVS